MFIRFDIIFFFVNHLCKFQLCSVYNERKHEIKQRTGKKKVLAKHFGSPGYPFLASSVIAVTKQKHAQPCSYLIFSRTRWT